MAVKFKRMVTLKQKIYDFILKLIKVNVKDVVEENICVACAHTATLYN